MEFAIIGPGGDELQLVKELPGNFTGSQLCRSAPLTAYAAFGEIVFQHLAVEDFEIWYSNYHLRHPAALTGRGDEPLFDLHIQFQNQFDIIWDGYGENTLRPYQYNLSHTPYLDTLLMFEGNEEYQIFNICFKLDYLQKISSSCIQLNSFIEKIHQGKAGNLFPVDRFLTPHMISILCSILKCEFNDRLTHFYIECKVKELLMLMLNDAGETNPGLPIKLSDYDVECLYEVRNLLEDFDQVLSLKQLSRKAGVNEFKLKKGFKYLFGNSVFAYRHGLRMEKARLMLLETTMPEHDIGFMMGFDYSENFRRAFKKYYGYSPAALRRSGK